MCEGEDHDDRDNEIETSILPKEIYFAGICSPQARNYNYLWHTEEGQIEIEMDERSRD